MNYCNATIIGHLVRDPESRSFPSGYALCSFTIAINYKHGEKSETAYIDCKCWGDRGVALAQYHKKGDPILVQGQIKQENWEDKTTGGKRSKLVLDVREFSFVKPYDGDDQSTKDRKEIEKSPNPGGFDMTPTGGHAPIQASSTISEDDIPF